MQINIHSKHNQSEGITLDKHLNNVFDKVFLMLILGIPGSGKSTLLINLITNQAYLSKKFNRIIYVTPTKFEHQKINMNEKNWNKKFDVNWVQQKIKDANRDGIKNMLFIFDDVISYWNDKNNKKFIQDFIWNRRHLLQNGSISIIITSQRYNALPTDVRSSLTNIILFRQTTRESDFIYKDSNSTLQASQFKHLTTNLKKGQYLILNCLNGSLFDKKLKKKT